MINGKKTIDMVLSAIEEIGLPWAYMVIKDDSIEPPFVVYYGAGQNNLSADDTHFWSENTYNIEYYFTKKSNTNEEGIEAAILAAGFQYEKGEDSYLSDEDIFVIYYYLN